MDPNNNSDIIPSWLPDFLEQVPGVGIMEDLTGERTARGLYDPWPCFLEQKLIDSDLPTSRLLDFFMTKYPALTPTSLEAVDKIDHSEVFLKDFIDGFHIVPFNYADPFLSVAVMDPDLLADFYPQYVAWAKGHKFSLLQYFIALPTDLKNFLDRRET